jgi:endonuclease/exonuclease/phosphatase family metal-dependent hydrolase
MRRSLAAVLLAVLAACGGETQSQLNVASRNLYLGGDIFSVVQAPDAQGAAVAVFQVWTSVQATNFPARATLIANEIASLNPDVIGLQEVAIWRTGAPLVCDPSGAGLPVINAPQASNVQYDYLTLLLTALQQKGLAYEAVQVTQSFDAELCALNPADPANPIDVRYTDRDVILVRQGLATRNADGGIYAAGVEFPIPGTPVTVPEHRAWNVVEVEKDGQWYRVFETHLEVQELPTPPGVPGYVVQLAQAGELIGTQVVPRRVSNPIPSIVVGDFNTQAELPPADPARTTYNYVSGAIPFPDLGIPELAPLVGTTSPLRDAWTATNGTASGLTWGYASDLTAGTLSQRIDFCLTWDATPVSMTTFGADDLTSTTPALHSSDHLGVAATIQP